MRGERHTVTIAAIRPALQFAEKIVSFLDAQRQHVCCLSIQLRYLLNPGLK